jgi:hypothetical protein
MGASIGIEQQLVGVEAMPGVRLIRAVDAVAIERAGLDAGNVAVENLVGIFRQFEPVGLALAVEQAHLNLGGVGGKQREIGPLIGTLAAPAGSQRVRQPFFDGEICHLNPKPMARPSSNAVGHKMLQERMTICDAMQVFEIMWIYGCPTRRP